MSKEAYYFSHDANARQDEKILMLRADYGWEGYGIYWALVEMMFESSDSTLHHNKTKGISVSYNIAIALLESVINTCITEGLFVSDGEKFWSESLNRRKNKYKEMKEKKAEAGRKGMEKRWGKQQKDNTVITEDNIPDNTVITKNNKGKESKVNKSKEKKEYIHYAERVKMSADEYKKLVEKLGSEKSTQDFIERLDLYKGSTGTNKYKDDYLTILNWHRKDLEKNPSLENKREPKRNNDHIEKMKQLHGG